jgi:trimethylamine:corrinoid methyltransferase-like protein
MRDLYLPKYIDRRPYTVWEEKQDGACDWARAKAQQILQSHVPKPLDPVLKVELQQMISKMEKGKNKCRQK